MEFDMYLADWDGEWCGTGPVIPLPQPAPDPWDPRVAMELDEQGLWPFVDRPVDMVGPDPVPWEPQPQPWKAAFDGIDGESVAQRGAHMNMIRNLKG